MKALVFDGELRLTDIPIPERNGEALIRVTHAGICNTDIELVKGYMGFNGVLGHEFVGRVEAAENAALIGKRVVGEINAGCGKCEKCGAKDPRHCEIRTVLGIAGRQGAFAEYLTLPESNLLIVPDTVSDEAAVLIEPLAAACRITEQLDVNGLATLIIGDGKLAQLIARVLPLSGARCDLLGKHAWKRDRVPLPCKTMALDDYEPSRSYDLAVEASGSPEGFATARRSVRPQGTIVLKSTYASKLHLNAAPIVVDEVTVLGSRCGRFEQALSLVEDRKLDPTDLITHRFALEQGVEAFVASRGSDAMKVILEIA
jgi:2-desacetyl-2-hydroxyethyl bacteriochlorophyllide A dehydrogenase